MQDLAVVIPAFKTKYFEKTLNCFAIQTNKNFTVYVGDDCSPDNIKEICDRFKEELDIVYTRFENNIGAKNLVHQWSRSIALTKNETWIWLFSDDDIIDNNCVENFYQAIYSNKTFIVTDIYRFNTIVIDQNDNIISEPSKGPNFESSEAMAYNLLIGKRSNSLADHIFKRAIYESSGGLVFTEYAQGADWAMSILFSKSKGISIIPGSNFYWRYSGTNISSSIGRAKTGMINGHLQFIKWICEHFKYLKNGNYNIKYEMILSATEKNLKDVLLYHYKVLPRKSLFPIIKILQNELGLSAFEIFKFMLFIFKLTNKQYKFISEVKKNFLSKLAF